MALGRTAEAQLALGARRLSLSTPEPGLTLHVNRRTASPAYGMSAATSDGEALSSGST